MELWNLKVKVMNLIYHGYIKNNDKSTNDKLCASTVMYRIDLR